MVKTKKGGKLMNPTDAYRKELRKKELKRNKKERKKVREVGILKKDPDQIKGQIQKLEIMKADGALDKARKHKKRQLEDTLNLVLKKRKEYEEKMKEKGEAPVMFSHLGPPPRRRTTAEEEERVNHPRPEDSVYYHPTLNPTGAPPPGKPPMYKSSIGPRIPLSTDSLDASTSGTAAPFLETETDDVASGVPPPPPPPPLPEASKSASGDGHINPVSLPLPPPPPVLPKAPAPSNMGQLPPSLLPPPPPGPPPKDQVAAHPPLPPPPPLPQAARHQPPAAGGTDGEKNQSASTDDLASKVPNQVHMVLPPPPPPPGLKSTSGTSESAPSEAVNGASVTKDVPSMIPPPPPPRHPLPGPPPLPAIQPDVLPPGISRLPPPPPPPAMQPPASVPGVPGQVAPSGFMAPFIPRPPYGPPPGPPLMMRPPPPLGPPMLQEDASNRQYAPQKPSYVKSAAPTVVKRPLAQHTPELTSMIPASVRVKRETALPKPKPKPSLASTSSVANRQVAPTVIKSEPVSTSTIPKGQSIDDSYSAFLEDMKALGALDS